MTGLRLYGAIGGLLLLLFVIAGAVWLIRENDRLAAVEQRGLACEAAVKNGEPTALNCPQVIADAATLADRYRQCDAALKASDAYSVQAACSEQVKSRDAAATALAADLADVKARLAAERAATGAAISRATARATALNRKDRNAQAALAAAPRGADGRIRCDDQCLRALAGN
jgi:hypothetical protein